jgi:hypothetical protein
MFPPEHASDLDPVALICDGIKRSATADRSGWSDAARSEYLVELLTAAERLRAEIVREASEWDARQAWAADGALSASSWVAHRTSLGKRDANVLIRTGRLIARHGAMATALASGVITAPKVDVLAAAARNRVPLFVRDENVLVNAAPTLSTDDFTTLTKRWRSYADDEMANVDARHVFDTRELRLTDTLCGRVVVSGSLDPEAAAIVRAAIDAYDRPDPEDGVEAPRTLAQRHADTLVQICSEAVGRLQAERGLHHVPGVELVWDQSPRSLESDDSARSTPPSVADLLPTREITGARPVSGEAARRIACDASVRRVVMDGPSEVLDLGRSSRLVSRAQRRALEHRDRGCAFPGCDAPVNWCDAHHVIHWEDGGATTLANLVLLCRRHHVACHEGGWQIERDPATGSVDAVTRGQPTRTRDRPRSSPSPRRDRTRPTTRGPTATAERREPVPS